MIDLLVAGIAPSAYERPYWDALREHRLALQRCTDCFRLQHYPRAVCTSCLSSALDYVESSGDGALYSFTIVHRAPLAALRPLTPYAIGLVDLDDGIRMFSAIACDTSSVEIGKRVTVDFLDVTDQVTLPIFCPAETA